MRTARHILSAILILALLSSGLPFFTPEDANRDSRVDLRDAIVAVRGLQAFSEIGGRDSTKDLTLRSRLEKALEAFKALAGEKSLVSAKDGKALPSSIGIFLALLPSSISEPLLRPEPLPISHKNNFQSIDIEPLTPPPKPAC